MIRWKTRLRKTPLRPKGSIFSQRARLKRDPLDALFSKVILLRDPVCRLKFRCRGDRSVETCHIFGRARQSIRHDEDNALGGCWACHRWADEHKTELEALAFRELGQERYARLLVRKELTARQAGVDRYAVRVDLKARLQALQREKP